VRITIEGHGYAHVPKQRLDQFGVDTSPQEQSGARVPEILPADRGETRVLEERLEVPVDNVLGVERSTFPGREYEP
jgi:hypothetical protein